MRRLEVLAVLLAVPCVANAEPLSRKQVLERVDRFVDLEWDLESSDCTGCTCPSSYKSDYQPGSHRGMPYKWGGYDEVEAFVDKIGRGHGAGSHKKHGVLKCVAGVDCSGLVSLAWGTSKKYSTSTLHQVTETIDFEDLEAGDALNKAGNHVVLFAGTRNDGVPIFYEAAGGPGRVRLHHHASWSYLNGYRPVRYKHIQAGPPACEGTVAKPIVVSSFPFEEQRSMFLACSDTFDSYSCKAHADESGKEYVYRFAVPKKSRLLASVEVPKFVDVDLHVLSAPKAEACVKRADKSLNVVLDAGTYYLVTDTWTDRSDVERSGPYRLKLELFEEPDVEASIENRDAGTQTAARGPTGSTGSTEAPKDDGCGCSTSRTGSGSGVAWLVLGLLAWRRR
ncbi:MAG: hypothetical protein RMA76_43670 [Deltaproteobacteria bacterium]|jgi:MYXO-CTERM domain-containing protein